MGQDSLGGPGVKNPTANAGDPGSVPAPGRPPHAVEQLSVSVTTTEPKGPRAALKEATAERRPHLFSACYLKVKAAQSCGLCNPVDYTVHGILQARILEWVAFPFSRGSS